MAQCFTEAKPYNSSSLHMHGSAYTDQFFSLNHVNGNLDRAQGYSFREGSLKEGGVIKGNGSFGMPGGGVYKANKEIYEDRADISGHLKLSIKEERSNTRSTKERASGGSANSRAHSLDSNSASAVSPAPQPHMKIAEGCSFEGAFMVNSSVLGGCSKVDEVKSRNLDGRSLGNGELVQTVANCSSTLQPTKSAGKNSSLWSEDSQSERMASFNSGIETRVKSGSSAPWNGSGGNCAVKGSCNTDHMNSGMLAIGSTRKVGDNLKPNQSGRSSFVKDRFMAESSAGRRSHSTVFARGDVSQVPGEITDGAAMVGNSNVNASADIGAIQGAAVAGEIGSQMGPGPELLLQKTKTPVQSWPNSPANLRAVPRSRNLSEGSFNLIFPAGDLENATSGTRSNTGSPSRSSFWSPDSGDSKNTSTSRSSLDRCLLASMYPPVSSLGAATRTRSSPEISSDWGSPGIQSPAGDVQFAHSDRLSRGHESSNDSDCISSTTLKLSENLGPKLMPLVSEKNLNKGPPASSSQPESLIPSSGPSKIGKLSNSEHQNRSSIETCIAQTSCDLRCMPASSHSGNKIFNQGISTGGSFGCTVSTSSVASPNTGTSEGMIPPVFGNITKGYHNATKLTTLPSSFGNIIKENSRLDLKKPRAQTNGHAGDDSFLLRKALLSMEPEEVKSYGNDQYKKGRFSEALLLYERAIVLFPGQALYHSNRAAALAAVGRLGDAVQDCQEAIKLDPFYGRAHQRLASLFLRLGRAEDARQHFKSAGNLCDQRDIQQSDIMLRHIEKCLEARMARDWANVVRESDAAVVAGADSASKVFALKAEALLHMGKTDEAKRVVSAAQKVENSLRGNVPFGESIVEVIQAKIDLALGNFQDAIVAAEKAVQIDSKNMEAVAVLQKVRAIGRSRTMGNELYKAGKYFEASAAYGEGLEHDPTNAILFCNRAACRSNLGLWESAIEDCDAALTAQPNYTKARLRRAHCLSKLEHWEEALRDYEMLKRELPGDIEVDKALQTALEMSRGEEELFLKVFGEGIDTVSSTNQFKAAVTSPGLALVHFNSEGNRTCRQLSAYIIQLRQKYPAVNFVKVDVEENLQLAKLENITTVPTFQLYRNSLKVKEIEGPSYETLEQAIQLFIL